MVFLGGGGVIRRIVYLPPPAAQYVGPGDVVSGAKAFWGVRAYTYASIGSSAIRLRRDSDNAESDFVTLSDGGLDLASIATFKGAANLFVTKLYDQTGGGIHIVQSTAGSQPDFVTAAGPNSLPAMQCVVTDNLVTSATQSQTAPWTVTGVFQSTDATNEQRFWSAGNMTAGINRGGVTDRFMIYDDTTDPVWRYDDGTTGTTLHAVAYVFDTATPAIYDDGVALTVASNGAWSGQAIVGLTVGSPDFNGQGMIGYWMECGWWPSAFSAGQASSMHDNQHGYWGT